MKTYFLTRYGNGEDDEGPDSSSDTHIIVRAETLERACEIGEPHIARLPRRTDKGREVAAFARVATLIGSSENEKEQEGIVCYPWYSQSHPQNCTQIWKRETIESGWVTFEEYHGQAPS